MQSIAIFASGSGTNAQRIIEYFSGNPGIQVKLVLCNKPGAGVLRRAEALHVPTVVFTREQFYNSTEILDILRGEEISFVVLAGFLWLIPDYLLNAYCSRIINIHPALLPRYGGKGMYGHHVHEAVLKNGDTESGITIHYVNSRYDEGDIIYQARCPVKADDTPDSLAARIHELEYRYFPAVIEEVVSKLPAKG